MLVIDTETGGLDPARCALIGIGAIHVESGAEFSLLLKPHAGLDLDSEALEVTGMSADHLMKVGTDEGDAMRMFAMWLHVFGRQEWCGCNPHFDRQFLDAAFVRHGIDKRIPHRAIDLQTLAWMAYTMGRLDLPVGKHGMPSRSLDAILEALGLARSSDRHDALEDARLTMRALQRLHTRISGH